MLKRYLIVGIFFLVVHQGMSQGEIYASGSKQRPPDSRELETVSLKESLGQLEKQFEVSIAYKDEWVNSRTVQISSDGFSNVEEALTALLSDTDLYFEKAGKGFYVISLKKGEGQSQAQSSLLLKTPSFYSNFTASTSFSAPDLQSIPLMNYYNDPAVSITGTVTDETGAGFPGVNVLVKGTSIGTSTDVNGKYSLSVDDENAVLVFSFIGYTTQEEAVGARTVVNVTMAPDVKALEEVVVTALGIERSSKSLGYATAQVNSDQIAVNRSTSVMNTLQGKIAGVNISTLGTGPSGSSKIRIRGQSSISGQNTPLIVINGVPMDNTNFGTNQGNTAGDNSVANRGGGASADGGDGLSSINPDDVESMTVLKGAAASALYGSRAKDGVIMITTKTKGATKGIGVTYNMNYTDETPLDFTDYQYEYGQGMNGAGPASSNAAPNPNSGQFSFGPKIQPGMTQLLFQNTRVPYVGNKGIITDFYRHGQNLTNTISLAASGEKGGMNVSFSNLNSDGITPGNTFNRKTINLGFQYDMSERLSFKGSINYSNEYTKNPPVVADQDNSLPTTFYAMANTMPLSALRDNVYNAAGGEYPWSSFTNRANPYWILNEVKQNIRRDRIFGNISVKYDIAKWLFAQVRVGQDYWSRDQDYINLPTGKASINGSSVFSASAPSFYNGLYTQDSRRFRETNVDFLLSGTKDFGDIGLNITAGGNQMYRRSDLNSVQVTDFVVKGLYTVQNGRLKDPLYDLSERAVNSLYGSAEVNYKKYLYLNITARNDWFSTLSAANRSIFYPSVSASYVFTESFTSKPSWLDFGKFRAAYAETGSDTDVLPYSNKLFYGLNAAQFNGLAVGNFASGLVVPNANLRPMRLKEVELGIETKMLDGRLGIDLAVYRRLTIDQIVNAQISDGSGFTTTKINSGQSENKGIEMAINITPVRTTDFQWDFTFTGAYNITKVLSLLTDKPGENITTGTHVFNGFVQQIVGQEMGQIVGFGYRRDDGVVNPAALGQIVYGSNGNPLPSTSLMSFGSALPKWVGGFNNTFTYKGVTLSVLIDFKLGGKVLSGTYFNAYREGLAKETLPGREGGTKDPVSGADPGAVVGVGVNEAHQTNTTVAQAQNFYSSIRGTGLVEQSIFDAGYWKLRQITVGYDFTKFLKPNSPFKGIKLSFVANNVLIIKKWVPNIDPESFAYTSDNVVGLESPSVPTTRSLGFNLNVKF